MITDPQMHETPPKKAEEHPKKGRIWPKMAKNGKMRFSQNPPMSGFCKKIVVSDTFSFPKSLTELVGDLIFLK